MTMEIFLMRKWIQFTNDHFKNLTIFEFSILPQRGTLNWDVTLHSMRVMKKVTTLTGIGCTVQLEKPSEDFVSKETVVIASTGNCL